MRKLFLILGIILAVYACQEVHEAEVNEVKHPDEIVNPNGDSELAIVMRNIHFEANRVGRALENGEEVDLSDLEDLSARLSTSVPTDSSVLDEAYYAFASSLEERVHAMGKEDAVIQFNSMVQACVTCHKSTCPGPISKIKKLRINS